VPLVAAGDDLAGLLTHALRAADLALEPGDIVAVAQKIVSKAEGRRVLLAGITPSPRAVEIATTANKDPRVVELILAESTAVLRVSHGVIITEHKSGVVLANAGIDRSNLDGGEDAVLLLPVDADASARRLRDALEREFGAPLGVLVTDSVGRAWRLGTTGTAIGASGVLALNDLRGQPDLFGRILQVSEVAVADSLAAAAVLAMGEAAERTPLVLIRGAASAVQRAGNQDARTALRPRAEDLFR
jgi:coenzyme F420-0:L-glutamate ligase/coenzyme F420-1:gamma-L-glutamate ligase